MNTSESILRANRNGSASYTDDHQNIRTRISIDRIFYSYRCQIILFWQSKDPLDHADTPIPTAITPNPTPLSWNSQREIQLTSRAALEGYFKQPIFAFHDE